MNPGKFSKFFYDDFSLTLYCSAVSKVIAAVLNTCSSRQAVIPYQLGDWCLSCGFSCLALSGFLHNMGLHEPTRALFGMFLFEATVETEPFSGALNKPDDPTLLT